MNNTKRDATLKILNAARTTGKFDELPDITPENIQLTLRTLPFERMNDFLNVLTKIVRQESYSVVFDRNRNPFTRFFKDPMPVGMTIEHLFVEVIKGSLPAWDDDGTVALSKVNPPIRAQYTNLNWEAQYKISISYEQAQTAFLSVEGAGLLLNKIQASINTAYEWDLILKGYELLSKAINDGYVNPIYRQYSFLNEADGKNLIVDINNSISEFTQTLTNENKMNVMNMSDEAIVIMSANTYNMLRANTYASAYNLEQLRLDGQLLIVPNNIGFGPLVNNDNVFAMVIDPRMLYIFSQLDGVGSTIQNPASLVVNYFRTSKWSFSLLGFANGRVFINNVGNALTVDAGTATVALADSEGTAITAGSSVLPFTEVVANITPSSGNQISAVGLNFTGEGSEYTIPITVGSDGKYTFTMPAHSATLQITETAATAAAAAKK